MKRVFAVKMLLKLHKHSVSGIVKLGVLLDKVLKYLKKYLHNVTSELCQSALRKIEKLI